MQAPSYYWYSLYFPYYRHDLALITDERNRKRRLARPPFGLSLARASCGKMVSLAGGTDELQNIHRGICHRTWGVRVQILGYNPIVRLTHHVSEPYLPTARARSAGRIGASRAGCWRSRPKAYK